MSAFLGVGIALHGEAEYLDLVAGLIEDEADYFEIAPEALLVPDSNPPRPNRYFERFRDLQERLGRPFVGHGLQASLASSLGSLESLEFERWLKGLRLVQGSFDLQWFSDHLGWHRLRDGDRILPLPVPRTQRGLEAVAGKLAAIADVVPEIAVETSADFFRLGSACDEVSFLESLATAANCHIVLDLHNLFCESVNVGLNLDDFIARFDFSRVVEIHLAGGGWSDAEWFESGRRFRIDGHDALVPEEVWALLSRILPLCSNLRGLLLERLDGSFSAEDLPLLREELARIKEAVRSHPRLGRDRMNPDLRSVSGAGPSRAGLKPSSPAAEPAITMSSGDDLLAIQELLFRAIGSPDGWDMLRTEAETFGVQESFSCVDRDAFEFTSWIVEKLRFQRLCLVAPELLSEFEASPEATLKRFESYCALHSNPAAAIFEEAQRWRSFEASRS